jgi:hypothetical protein
MYNHAEGVVHPLHPLLSPLFISPLKACDPSRKKLILLVYPSCVGVLTAIAYFSIVYCCTCMKTHIASEIESGEVVYKEKYRH